MKNFILILTSAILLVGNAYATDHTSDLKISVIDLHQLIQEAPQAKKISKKLRNQFKPRQDKIAKAQTGINP